MSYSHQTYQISREEYNYLIGAKKFNSMLRLSTANDLCYWRGSKSELADLISMIAYVYDYTDSVSSQTRLSCFLNCSLEPFRKLACPSLFN